MEVVKSRISGAWKWNEIIKFSFQGTEKIKFFYQKNHTIFPADEMTVDPSEKGSYVAITYNENNGIGEEIANSALGWAGEGYDDSSVFYFGEEPQEISTDLYAYILDNATPIEWSTYAQWLGEGEWHWNNTLTIPNAVFGFYNVVVANTVYKKALFVSESNVLSGAFNNTGCFYLSGNGWLDGSLSVEDILNGAQPNASDILQTWQFNGGYVSIPAYMYLYQNAKKEKDMLIKERTMEAIAEAIRSKTGKIARIPGSRMPEEIRSIPQDGEVKPVSLQKKSAIPSTLNQRVVPDDGYDGLSEVAIAGIQTEEKTLRENGEHKPSSGAFFSKVTVDVPAPSIDLQDKTVNPKTKDQEVKADSGYDGLNKVTVKAVQTETTDIDKNGTYTPTTGKYFSSVTVNVPAPTPKLQSKSASPSKTKQEITPDIGYDGLSMVEIAAAPLREKDITPLETDIPVYPGYDDNGNPYYGLSKVIVRAIPSDYIIPTGMLEITSIDIRTYDVKERASVKINLNIGKYPGIITPGIDDQTIKASAVGLQAFTEITIAAVPASESGFNTGTLSVTPKLDETQVFNAANSGLDGYSEVTVKPITDIYPIYGGEAYILE